MDYESIQTNNSQVIVNIFAGVDSNFLLVDKTGGSTIIDYKTYKGNQMQPINKEMVNILKIKNNFKPIFKVFIQFNRLALITPKTRNLKHIQSNIKYMETIFSSPAYLSASFMIKELGNNISTDLYKASTNENPNIDYNEIDEVFGILADIKNTEISVNTKFKL